ncbi:MAG: TIGR00730 family Rossman fold protein [Sphingomonadales bacterium]|nr:TIGR00730 family Rossman fold protein [Sphingomonadales bacterium]
MKNVQSICVYCGSRTGDDPSYVSLANELGRIMAGNDIKLVYGGGSIGLMGVVADSVVDNGGHVIGFIPEHLDSVEISYTRAQEMHVVPNMHVRKKGMFDKSDAFVILPGGLGSLDETFEIITWAQLGLHDKPVIIVNHNKYWQPLLDLIDHVVDKNFAGPSSKELYTVVERADQVLKAIEDYRTPRTPPLSEFF